MIALPAGKNYGIFVEKHGYVPKSIDINLIDSLSRDLTYDFSLQAVATAAKNKTEITLENIYFDYDKSSLKKESVPALKRFVEFLQKEDKYDILIEGHTDELGSEEYNLQLSKKRADEVFRFLKNAGINPERITTKAYGETKPLSNQKSDLSKNRRVSFRLILR
jgi:outer membrane protein OmpA-like peptidoglycan-associated protein